MNYNEFLNKYALNENFKLKYIAEPRNHKMDLLGTKHCELSFKNSYFPIIPSSEATEEEKEQYISFYSIMYGI